MNLEVLTNTGTEIGNTMFLLASAIGVFYAAKWRAQGKLSLDSQRIILAWECILVSVGVRIGWWALALHFAPAGETYNHWFVDWKWAMTIPTAVLFTYGILEFIHIIEGFSIRKKAYLVVASFIIASTISYM